MVQTHPRIGIALCTYNGAAYVEEQLDSLAAQTRRPDTLLVCDDRSTDDTVERVHRFAARAPFPVRVEVNPKNLGVWDNFARALERSDGEVVMFCDQDDVWRTDKVERFAQELGDPRVGLVFCDARVVDPNLNPLGHTHWQSVDFTPALRARFAGGGGFGVLLRHSFVACATMAVRARLREVILPIPDGWAFDAWAAVVASAVSESRVIDEPLNDYRQHPRQALGGARKGPWRRYVEARRAADEMYYRRSAEMVRQLRDRLSGRVDADRLREVESKLRFAEARASMRRSALRRYPLIVGQLLRGNYWRYGQGLRSVVVDALV